jgi:hypothetical protein
MTEQRYPWKRFWVPRTGILRFSHNGYLLDPDEEHGRIANPDAVPFEAIADTPCLALLGEPGIGKTEALKTLADPQTRAKGAGATWFIALDLRSYGDEGRLRHDLFESPEFSSWINSTEVLEIFLDSLDECLIHLRTVAAFLVDEFKKYPVSRMRLRIACRAVEWPALLDQELPKIWGAPNFHSYELAPLRRLDIENLARASGVSGGAFLAEVERQDVVPLAIVPITLQLLLRVFQEGGQLPGTRIDLYKQGCLTLIRESNLSRRASGASGTLDASDRLIIAERIAAVTMFSKRPTVYLGDDEHRPPGFDVTLRDLASDPEFIGTNRLAFSTADIRETLRASLFTSVPIERRTWLHWTFAEFLAAQWAVTRRLTINQLGELIFHPDVEGRNRVVPQLHETAAWLAAMCPDLMDRVVESDPQVLLRSTIAQTDGNTRSRIVDSLLRLLDSEKITDTDVEMRRRYDILAHPGLPGQLLPYITNRSKNVMVRRAAIDIGAASNATDLGDTLVTIALDQGEERLIRAQAAHAVKRIGSWELRSKLRPLLQTTREEDPDEQIRGNALDALSDQLTGAEIFACITPPRSSNFFGVYKYFLEYEFPGRLKEADLPAALAWVADQPREVDEDFGLQRLAAAILDLAWSHIDGPGVVQALAKVVVARLEHHDSLFERHGSDDVRKRIAHQFDVRKRVLRSVVPDLRGEQHRYTRIGLVHSGLVLSTDVPWLIAELDSADAEDKECWALLIALVFNPEISGQYDLVLSAKTRNPALATEVGWRFETVLLDSPQADKMRADYAEQIRWQKRQEADSPKHPPMPEIVTRWLERFESGNVNAWWRLNLDLTLTPDANHYGDELQGDLTLLPGWDKIDESLRDRCLAAAERYLYDANPRTADWLGTNTLHRPAFAGYRALRLLLRLKPEVLVTLSAAVWEKWAPVILAYPESPGGDEEHAAEKLVALAYESASEAVIEVLGQLIDKENADHGMVFITRKLACSWDSRLISALLEKVHSDPVLKPPAIRELLSETLSHDGQAAVDLALSILKGDKDAQSLARRVEAGAALLSTVPDQVWPAIWQLIQKEPDLGRKLFLEFAHQPGELRRIGLAGQLCEMAVADLYLWLADQFPHSADPTHEGPLAHAIGERDSVAMFRDGLLNYLTERGTRDAVVGVRRIAAKRGSDLPWLKYVALRADAARLRQEWEGIAPEILFRLARNPEARLVESEDQLLDLVCESLNRLQAKLYGAPPALPDLWNDDLTPKDEEHLSNYVQRHLTEDLSVERGLVANREVRIRPGQSTDIHVDAIKKDARTGEFQQLTVIIEVKGCWNRGLKTEMKNQLKDRYLRENQCQQGIYLVGWFLCDRWSASDYRRDATPKLMLAEAKRFFDSQAKEVSDSVTIRAIVLDASLR